MLRGAAGREKSAVFSSSVLSENWKELEPVWLRNPLEYGRFEPASEPEML